MQHPIRKRTNYAIGVEAEERAKSVLAERGFSVVASRFQVGYGIDAGEVDIIAKNDSKKILAFIEVKKRKTISLAAESISDTQMGRIYSSAEVFISKHPEFSDFNFRFDAVLFDDKFDCEYIENAWGL